MNELSNEELDAIIQSFKGLDLDPIINEIESKMDSSIDFPEYKESFLAIYSYCYYIKGINDKEGMKNFIFCITYTKHKIHMMQRRKDKNVKDFVKGYQDAIEMLMPILSISFSNWR